MNGLHTGIMPVHIAPTSKMVTDCSGMMVQPHKVSIWTYASTRAFFLVSSSYARRGAILQSEIREFLCEKYHSAPCKQTGSVHAIFVPSNICRACPFVPVNGFLLAAREHVVSGPWSNNAALTCMLWAFIVSAADGLCAQLESIQGRLVCHAI